MTLVDLQMAFYFDNEPDLKFAKQIWDSVKESKR